MKNLENYDVYELDCNELVDKDGGWLAIPVAVAGAIIGFVIDQYNDVKKGWQDASVGKKYDYKFCQ